jgi:hypothetical protein
MSEFCVNQLKWSKKLYLKTGHPDNYVDDSFLDLKRTNGQRLLFQSVQISTKYT